LQDNANRGLASPHGSAMMSAKERAPWTFVIVTW